jgi:hypothetical protein
VIARVLGVLSLLELRNDWKLTILIFNKLLGVKDIREKSSDVKFCWNPTDGYFVCNEVPSLRSKVRFLPINILATGTFGSWYFELLDKKKRFYRMTSLPWGKDRVIPQSLIDNAFQYQLWLSLAWFYLPLRIYWAVGGGGRMYSLYVSSGVIACATSLAKWFNGWSPSKDQATVILGIVINCNAGRF